MSRKKEFQYDQVLNKAMWTFWTNGYHATSMKNLVESMGINRFTIYANFENKRNLFLLVLDRYQQEIMAPINNILLESQEGIESIYIYFNSFVQLHVQGKFPNGCLMVNTICELGTHDPEIRQLGEQYLSRLNQAFSLALTRARNRDEIRPDIDLQSTAQFLTGCMEALGILVKIQNQAELSAYVEASLTPLTSK